MTAAALGVNVVSTTPVTIDGSAQPGTRTATGEALDPDDFSGGFAAWSGTSFSTPILAGRYLRALTASGFRDSLSRRRELLRTLLRGGAAPDN